LVGIGFSYFYFNLNKVVVSSLMVVCKGSTNNSWQNTIHTNLTKDWVTRISLKTQVHRKGKHLLHHWCHPLLLFNDTNIIWLWKSCRTKEKIDGSSLISWTWGELDCLFKWNSDWHLGASFLYQSAQNSYQKCRRTIQ